MDLRRFSTAQAYEHQALLPSMSLHDLRLTCHRRYPWHATSQLCPFRYQAHRPSTAHALHTQVSFDLERTKRELSVPIRLSYTDRLGIRLSSHPAIYCSQNS